MPPLNPRRMNDDGNYEFEPTEGLDKWPNFYSQQTGREADPDVGSELREVEGMKISGPIGRMYAYAQGADTGKFPKMVLRSSLKPKRPKL